MLITIKEYARRHNRSPATIRQRVLRGASSSAVKIGRDWLIDEDEVLIDHRKKDRLFFEPEKEK